MSVSTSQIEFLIAIYLFLIVIAVKYLFIWFLSAIYVLFLLVVVMIFLYIDIYFRYYIFRYRYSIFFLLTLKYKIETVQWILFAWKELESELVAWYRFHETIWKAVIIIQFWPQMNIVSDYCYIRILLRGQYLSAYSKKSINSCESDSMSKNNQCGWHFESWL